MNRETRMMFCDLAQARIETRQEGEEEVPVLVGYAAVYYDGTEGTQFRLWEDYVERIAEGAFDDVLNDDVRGLVNHDVNHILGRTKAETMRLSADGKGLRYEIDAPDTQVGRDIQVSVKRRDVTGSSFSFQVDIDNGGETVIEEKDGMYIRTIKKVSALFDVGPVTFPAYPATSASARDMETAQAEIDEYRKRQGGLRAEDADIALLEKKMKMNA